MAIRILFDDTEIDSRAIMSLSQSGQLFDGSFKLGATLCRTVEMQINKDYVENSNPSVVKIYDDDIIKFTLYVDSVEDKDDRSYSYTLTDSMVKLNVALSSVFDWDTKKSYTVQKIVDNICDFIDSAHVTIEYIGDLAMSWDWDTTARDFLSYVAEINASFVRVNASGNIEFVEHNKAVTRKLDLMTCEDITVGEYHKIQRVGYEQGSASIFYPNEEVEYNTVYVNDSNVLITDSDDFTREGIIEHIYSKIANFEFYSFDTSKCEVDQDCVPGDMVQGLLIYEKLMETEDDKNLQTSLSENIIALVQNGNTVPFIAQIDWNYSSGWNGGYECELDTAKQEETSVDTATQYAKSIKIKVDREMNEISQSVSNLESSVREIAANDVDTVVVQYAQIQGELQPQAWSDNITWNDEYKTYYRAKITYVDTSEYYTESWLLEKEDGKTVSTVEALYQCGNINAIPILPTSVVTEEGTNVYNAWTKNCPIYNNQYPTYYITIQLGYSDGTYSWSTLRVAAQQSTVGVLSSKVKTIESNISTMTQTESEISATVTKITRTELPNLDTRTSILETCVQLQADGLKVSQGTEGAYTKITDDGMEIYSEGNLVAYTKKNGFYAIDYIMNGWHMVTANNKNSFCIVRKEYN